MAVGTGCMTCIDDPWEASHEGAESFYRDDAVLCRSVR